jgi:hypothetical protein
VLIHQIEDQTYQKTVQNQTNFDVALPEAIRAQASLAVKDEYTFDFLELADEHSERQLEQAILAKVEPFLMEMGGMYPPNTGSPRLSRPLGRPRGVPVNDFMASLIDPVRSRGEVRG